MSGRPMPVRAAAHGKTLVTGGNGQLARALRDEFADDADVEFVSRADLDLVTADVETARAWSEYSTIINAAAFTRVDAAETPEGRREAWASNVTGVARLARIAVAHRITLVHFSTDYVFDGSKVGPYTEEDPVSPLSVYGQTKAAADAVVSVVPRHYVLRTSWVVGDGTNFVRTMTSLAERGVRPRVVDDQIGRLTRASDLAATTRLLLSTDAPSGIYNVTGGGPATTWHQIARDVFEINGRDPDDVTGVSTEEYFRSATGVVAPRPRNSVLDLQRVTAVREGRVAAVRGRPSAATLTA